MRPGVSVCTCVRALARVCLCAVGPQTGLDSAIVFLSTNNGNIVEKKRGVFGAGKIYSV